MLKTLTATTVLVLAAATASAQTCPTTGLLTGKQINDLLVDNTGRYACGHNGTERWNETLSGGIVTDYKLGPNSTTDKSAAVGTYSVNNNGNDTGRITYTYGSASFVYNIVPVTGTTAPSPGQYLFCQIGGPTYSITVSAGATPGGC